MRAVMCAGQLGLQLERLSVTAHGFIVAPGLGERDRHVLQHAVIVRLIPERKPIGRQRGVVIALSFEHERFVEIIEALRLDLSGGLAAEYAAPPGHSVGIGC